jgi:acid phosphatase type 7
MKIIILLFVLISVALATDLPTQIHIALAGKDANGDPNGMAVSWNTKSKSATSTVKFGTISASYSSSTTGQSSSYYETFNHHVVLSNLQPDTQYFYVVGDETSGWSTEHTFHSAPTSSDLRNDFSFFVFGDLGQINGDATEKYIKSNADDVKLIWHAGDVGYADDAFLHLKCVLQFCYESAFDEYMTNIEEWASKVPYMVAPGNHEADCHDPACLISKDKREKLSNFTAYNNRFRMPSPESDGVMNMWYSFNYGNVHFISVNTETDYPGAPEETRYVLPCGGFGDQLTWLENDLKAATANRVQRPWILAAGHHPIYNGNSVDTHLQTAVEDLFYKYGVDVFFTGHVHSYERSYPVYKSNVEKSYENPTATTHILIGGPGNDEMRNTPGSSTLRGLLGSVGPWTVVQDDYYGIGKVTIIDDSNLKFEYIRTGTGEVFDSINLSRNRNVKQ